jgi:hypothetical protein
VRVGGLLQDILSDCLFFLVSSSPRKILGDGGSGVEGFVFLHEKTHVLSWFGTAGSPTGFCIFPSGSRFLGDSLFMEKTGKPMTGHLPLWRLLTFILIVFLS